MAHTAKTSTLKDEVIRMIEQLPDDCTLQQIQYHLYVREQVQEGLADIDAGRVVSHEAAKQTVAQWRKSTGRKRRSSM